MRYSMTAAEFQKACADRRLSQAAAAQLLGVQLRTVQRWWAHGVGTRAPAVRKALQVLQKPSPPEMVAVVQGTTTCIFICAEDVPALKKGQKLHVTHYGDGSMHIMPGMWMPTPEERLAVLERDLAQMGELLTTAANTLRAIEVRLKAEK